MTLPVLPVSDGRAPRSLGVRPLGDAPLTIRDADRLPGEIALRRRLLDEDHGARFAALPGTRDAQAAALRLVAADVRRQGEVLDPPADLADPLDWAGRHVAEDLLLLDATDPEVPLVAGSLCFPNGWEIRSALGGSIAAIHAPVPGFAATIGGPTLALMRRLRPARPVWRANLDAAHHRSPRPAAGHRAPPATRGRGPDLGAGGAPDAVPGPRRRRGAVHGAHALPDGRGGVRRPGPRPAPARRARRDGAGDARLQGDRRAGGAGHAVAGGPWCGPILNLIVILIVMLRRPLIVLACLGALAIAAVAAWAQAPERPRIVATTPILGSIVRDMVGDAPA